MGLLSLPAELIVSVFSLLPPKDIKKARLVCRAFSRYSSQYLIDSVFAGSQTNTLERLEEIAKHDIFSRTIRTVVYSTCSLPRNYATVKEYYAHLKQLWNRFKGETMPKKKQCTVYWTKYQDVYNDQVRVLRDGSEKTRIALALQRMPNVEHLVLSCDAWKSPAHPLHAVWDSKDYFIIRPTHDADDGPWQLSHGFKVMSSAFTANKIRPKSLIQTEPHYIWDFLRSDCFTAESLHFFEPLHKISLHFHERNITYMDEVKTCFSAAKRLQHLELQIEMFETQTAFNRLLSSSWPNLTSVSLSFDLDYEPFVAFCRRHRSVRSLCLTSCFLHDGSWKTLMPIIRECFHLTDARIESLNETDLELIWAGSTYTEDNTNDRIPEAEHYLVHGGENPFENGALELINH
jgi:hypothetical protein